MSAKNLPLVTIVTPTYNRAGYLPETIASVLSQNYPNIEYIVLDDGSTDETKEVLSRYEGMIRWYSHSNVGEAVTVNRGWQMAAGEFVCVVNSDDPILPGLVEESVKVLQGQQDLLVAYPDWVMTDSAGRYVRVVASQDFDYLKMVRWQECFVGPGAFIRRKAFDFELTRDPSYRYVGDFAYWLRLGLHGSFARVPMVLATHRVHPVSLSASGGVDGAKEYMRLLDEFYALPNIPPAVLKAKREAYSNAAYLAGRHCMRISLHAARDYFLTSLQYNPLAYIRRRPIRLAMILASLMPSAFAQAVRSRIEALARSPRRYFE